MAAICFVDLIPAAAAYASSILAGFFAREKEIKMSVNMKQFKKNKKWINKQIAHQYPGVKVHWSGFTPSIECPEELWPAHNEIIQAVQGLISQCGGDADFYPERAAAS